MRSNIKYGKFTFTWFPMEQRYMVFIEFNPISGWFKTTEGCEAFADNYKK